MILEDWDDEDILDAILEDSFDDSILVTLDDWRIICKVRDQHKALVSSQTWKDLCARRGYVLKRLNQRNK